MIRRRRTRQHQPPSGYFQFGNSQHRTISGYGEGSYVRLKDEFGKVWRGTAEVLEDRTVFYRFRSDAGKVISGVSDGYGILLRDERGQIWRGYVF
jgi:hypothetical protein